MIDFWQNLALNLDPVAFSIGSVDIRYYSLAYLLSFAVAYLLILYRLKFEGFAKKFSRDDIDTLVLISFLGVVLGGRLGYVLFYDFSYYLANPLQVVYPFDSEGNFTGLAGMSFHGGLIAVILGALAFIRHKKWKPIEVASLIVPCIPLGYMFGRIGNFLNNELWGAPTEFALGMYVAVGNVIVKLHPSQLYEAFFEGLLLFLLLWIFRYSRFVQKYALSCFLFGYGFVRFFIEYIRVPDAHLGYFWGVLSMGQILCLAMMVAAFIIPKFKAFKD